MSGAVEFWEDYEALVIETPEALTLRQPLAGFGPRFLALLLDVLIQTAVAAVLMVTVMALTVPVSATPDNSSMMLTVTLIVLVFLLVVVGYPALFETVWSGQTPGKRATGIRVIRRGGYPIGLREALLRNLLRLVDYLPSHGFIGLISFIVSSKQQRLGDLVADTVVVREFSSRQPFSWAATSLSGGPGNSPWLDARLSYIVASYLTRSIDLPPEVRFNLSGEIISQIGYESAKLSFAEREQYLQALLRGPAKEWA